MRTINTIAMQAYCDALTQDGTELSVTWEGGNDSGWFSLRLNGVEKTELTELEQDIVRLIENCMGYGCFSGDFSTSGEVNYCPQQKCFKGTDEYSETDNGNMTCDIEIKIPPHIWFDQLRLQIDCQGYALDVNLTAIIRNGPYPEAFDEISSQIQDDIEKKLLVAIDGLEDFEGLWHSFTLPRKDFEQRNGMLVYSIKSLDYSYYCHTDKDICIELAKYNRQWQ